MVVVLQEVEVHHHSSLTAQGGGVAQFALQMLQLCCEVLLVGIGVERGKHISIVWCIIVHAVCRRGDGRGEGDVGEGLHEAFLGTLHLMLAPDIGSYGNDDLRIHW